MSVSNGMRSRTNGQPKSGTNGQIEYFPDPTAEVIRRLTAGDWDVHENSGEQWESLCPGHSTKGISDNRNLQIERADNGGCVVHCFHAPSCSLEAIIGPLGLVAAQMFKGPPPERNGKKPKVRYAHGWDALAKLRAEHGEPHVYTYNEDFRIVRFREGGDKIMRPVSRNAEGWALCDPPGLLPLYNLYGLQAAAPGSVVWVVEGEKCVDAMTELGILAVTSAHGSSSARKSDWAPLKGYTVLLNPDHDEPGDAYIKSVERLLRDLGGALEVRVHKFDDHQAPGDDVVDWIARKRAASLDDAGIQALLKTFTDEAKLFKTPADSDAEIDDRLGVKSMGEEDMEDIDWIMQDCLAGGAITIVAGEGGCGKSQIGMSIAALVSRGGIFPGETEPTREGKVLILSSEDNRRKAIIPRLIASEANLSNIKTIEGYEKVVDSEGHEKTCFRSLQNYDWLERIFQKHPETRLLIVDTLTSFLGPGVNENQNNDIRHVFEPIVKILEQYDVALLGIAHTGKGSEARSIGNLLLGSVAYRNIARCLFFTFHDDEDPDLWYFCANKNNCGNLRPTSTYRIMEVLLPQNGTDKLIKTSRIEWLEGVCMVSADEAFEKHFRRKPRGGRRLVKKEDVIAFLRQVVNEQGPLPSKEVVTLAIQAGFNSNHVFNYKDEAGVRSKKIGVQWYMYTGEWTGIREDVAQENGVPY